MDGVAATERARCEEAQTTVDAPEDADTVAPLGSERVTAYQLFADLYRGAIRGAYALDELHAPGLLAWILLGFVPGVGALTAARDGYYAFEAVRDSRSTR